MIFGRKKKKQKQEEAVKAIAGLIQEVAVSDPRRLFYDGIQQYNPSVLVTRKGLRVFDEMKRDDQVKAALAFRKQAILSSGWEVVSPEGQGEGWEVREFVKKALDNLTMWGIRSSTLSESLYSVLSAMDYGYSVSEKLYEEKDGKVTLRSIKSVSPYYITLRTDRFGNLNYLAQSQSGYSDEKELPIHKFVIHINQPGFGNPYGTADLDSSYRPWLIKDNTYKWFAMFLEKLGIPPLFALFNPNVFTGSALADLKDVMTNLQSATVGTIPRPSDDSLEMWQPTVGSAGESRLIFRSAIELLNQDISRSLLLPGLLGMSGGDGESGSYARAKVHFDSFMMMVLDNRQRLAETIQSQLVQQLVDINFNVDRYPRFQFLPDSDKNMVEMVKTWIEMMKTGGVINGPEDEKHIRSVLGFPEKEDKSMSLSFSAGRVDFSAINSGLDEIEGEARSKLVSILTDTRDSMIKRYAGRDGAIDMDPGLINELKPKGGGLIQGAIQDMLRSAYGYGVETVSDEMRIKAGIFTPKSAIRYLTKKKFWIAGILKDHITKGAQAILYSAIKSGELAKETAGKLEAMFEKYIGTDIQKKTDSGYEVGSPYHIETIIRTNVTDAFNHGRLTEMLSNADILQGVEYSAILDQRTTDQCERLDGKIFRVTDPALTRFTPPLHYSCRSILVPRTIGETITEDQFITAQEVGRINELVPADFGGAA